VIKILQIQNPELSVLPTLTYTSYMDTGRYVSVIEAAEILGVHRHTVKNLLKRGQLKGEVVGNTWIVDRAELEEFAKTYTPKVGRPRTIRRRRSNALPDSVLAQIEAQSDWDNKVGS